MNHKMIFEHFSMLLPTYSYSVDSWFPNGPGSIMIRSKYQMGEYIFSYKSATEWAFETIDSYTNKLKERKKNDEIQRNKQNWD